MVRMFQLPQNVTKAPCSALHCGSHPGPLCLPPRPGPPWPALPCPALRCPPTLACPASTLPCPTTYPAPPCLTAMLVLFLQLRRNCADPVFAPSSHATCIAPGILKRCRKRHLRLQQIQPIVASLGLSCGMADGGEGGAERWWLGGKAACACFETQDFTSDFASDSALPGRTAPGSLLPLLAPPHHPYLFGRHTRWLHSTTPPTFRFSFLSPSAALRPEKHTHADGAKGKGAAVKLCVYRQGMRLVMAHLMTQLIAHLFQHVKHMNTHLAMAQLCCPTPHHPALPSHHLSLCLS